MALAEQITDYRQARQLPQNMQAEQEVLGAILIDNAIAGEVRGFLSADDFYHPSHQRIYAAALSAIDRGTIADPITLAEVEPQQGYLVGLTQAVSSRYSAPAYARVVRDHAVRRHLIALGEEIAARGYEASEDGDVGEQIAEAERALAEIGATGSDMPIRSLGEVLDRTLEIIEGRMSGKSPGAIPTGLSDYDRKTGGAPIGSLTIVAGRPSMGKSALVTTWAYNAARRGVGVMFNSLEMMAEELGVRILGMESRTAYDEAWNGRIDAQRFDALFNAATSARGLPMWIADRGRMSVNDFRATLRAAKRKHDIGLVVVDYIQIAQMADRYRGNRVAEIAEITASLKAMAKNEGVAVVALSQLSRESEKRADPTPILGDLRESGAIEQDADIVTFVHRPEIYIKRRIENAEAQNQDTSRDMADLEKARNKAVLVIGKNRMGPLGHVQTHFDGATSRFSDLDWRYE